MRARTTLPTLPAFRLPLLIALALAAWLAVPALAWPGRPRCRTRPRPRPYFLAIAKDSQTFLVMGRRARSVIKQLPCATGQADGDKLKEGDLRTPEGVYFVRRKLAGGLDYELYGDLAFTLDFPNPVDRARASPARASGSTARGRPIGRARPRAAWP
jgi:hypothetical protein